MAEEKTEKKRHILVSSETDSKIESIRKAMAEDGISVSRTAVVAMAINEKAAGSEFKR